MGVSKAKQKAYDQLRKVPFFSCDLNEVNP